MIRAEHGQTGCRPFELANCADLGDVGTNPADLQDSMARITSFFAAVCRANIIPLTVGGDHLLSLPKLRALGQHQPLGLVHFDSHSDLFSSYFDGSKYTHGTPFRRALEEGLLDPSHMVQIGLRGTCYDQEDREFAASAGIRQITIEEFFARGPEDVLAEAREIVGDAPTYVSYDIDFVDPAFAPGTGTPEIGGPSSYEALVVLRLLKGINIVGADLVEVSPPFDLSGNTALLGASILFELLCLIALKVATK